MINLASTQRHVVPKKKTKAPTVRAAGGVNRIVKVKKVLNPVGGGFDLRARIHEIVSVQRQAIQARRGSYRAASNARSRNQTPYGGSADQQIDPYTRRLCRELSRDLDRNADTFTVLMDYWQQAICGQAVKYRPKTGNPEWDQKASDLLDERMKIARDGVDVRGLRSGYQLLSDFVRATGVDGEGGLIKLDNGQAQAFESEQLTNGGRMNGSSVDGVDYNDDGSINNIKVCPFSPIGAISIAEAVEYKPEEFIWVALRKRFSQTRGLPLLVAAMDDWERLDSYRESEVIAAEQGSQLYGAIEHITGDMGNSSAYSPQDTSVDPATIMRGGINDRGNLDWQGTVAGAIMDLPNGKKYVPINPQRPNRDCAPFLIEMLRQFCGNAGLPYEFVYNDLRGLSWSMHRGLVVMARDRIATYQNNTFGPAFSEFYKWQLGWLIESGAIEEIKGWDRHELAWPQISWPDEGKEFEAQALGLSKGLTTRHRVYGPNWRDILRERLEELEEATELAEEHNKEHPDFPVDPWFFLGFVPDNQVKQSTNEDGVDGGDEVKTKLKKKDEEIEAMRLQLEAIKKKQK